MKHNIGGVIEHEGKRYDYEATVYTGDDADNRNLDTVDSITAQDESVDNNGDFEACGALEEKAMDDANERLRYCSGPDAIKDDETLDEYLTRMAKVWHPEELEDGSVRISKHEVMYVHLSFDGSLGVLDDLIDSGIGVDCGWRQVLAVADTLASKHEEASGKTKDVIIKICAKIEADGFDGDVIIYS